MVVKQSSTDLKLKAVKYYKQVNNYTKVCNIFECSERSLKRWVERYNQNENVERKNRKQGSYKVKKEHIKFIKDTLKKNNIIHMKQLHQLIINKYPTLKISRQYLSDIIRDNNITRKRATFAHFPKTYRGQIRNENQELKDFFKIIKKYKLDDIISIDESSVSTSLSINYCRNSLGKRCIIKSDNNFVFQKFSLLVAIDNTKCISYKLYDKGSVNGERFNEFLKDVCKNVKNKLIILDNGKIHKTEETKNIIKNSGNFLLYTCPYHPRLNCIEQWFNQVKHYMKIYKSNDFPELNSNLKKSINNINKDNYKNYFIYAYNKDLYKTLKRKKLSTKHRTLKIYKN
jgi:transposase